MLDMVLFDVFADFKVAELPHRHAEERLEERGDGDGGDR
jgi:hypothetical protein